MQAYFQGTSTFQTSLACSSKICYTFLMVASCLSPLLLFSLWLLYQPHSLRREFTFNVPHSSPLSQPSQLSQLKETSFSMSQVSQNLKIALSHVPSVSMSSTISYATMKKYCLNVPSVLLPQYECPEGTTKCQSQK